jgi:hypothetical protein
LSGRVNLALKKISARPAAGEGHERHAQSGEALGAQEVSGCGDEGLRIEGDQIGLLLVDPGLIGAFELVCFLRCESQVAEALV